MELPPNPGLVDVQRDALYAYDADAHKAVVNSRPWTTDYKYFKTVRISSVAMIKMVMHARSGGNLEVMGMMQGYIEGSTMVITDAYRLPVEGTETRVNAQDEANEYMVEYLRLCREENRLENVIGWYHSHPGYGCWLSGIDVGTQSLQQQFNEPFVAVVIDPDRTVSQNKVEIGAFRTIPEGVKPPAATNATTGDGQSVPLNKVEDFGAHSHRYYALDVEHFKSTLDSKLLETLWNKYWVQTLAQNPLLTNRDYTSSQLVDLGSRISKASKTLETLSTTGQRGPKSDAVDQNIEKLLGEVKQIAAKERSGLMAAEVKGKVFGCGCRGKAQGAQPENP
ncbi:COP9 signalosome complex subunit 5 [Neurospora tetraspora]|uniref:COP9 signalosome complex subunit 5 n=1 Tax=Neurospora tetraspora TaxID=94610 RepID=A0AAE0JBD9_9PEZI|nr:COP9 signalosome complex subunit 5 [Neurospora tetraspora]